MTIARQELPGNGSKNDKVPTGTAELQPISRPYRDYPSFSGTRQFLPGYFQPRLAALISRAGLVIPHNNSVPSLAMC
jgi:hypothetical protein